MRYYDLLEDINVEKTDLNFGKKLELRLKEENLKLTSKQAIQEIMNFDPTPHKQYTLWIIRTYLSKGIRKFEDLSRTKKALTLFHKFKKKIDQNQRDINKLKSLFELENIVNPFVNRETKIKSKDDLDESEYEMIFDDKDYRIVIPLSHRASCYFGKNTRWCTTEKDNDKHFNSYSSKGPLIYMLEKKTNKRFAYHENETLTDELDLDILNDQSEISLNEFKNKYTIFLTHLNKYVKNAYRRYLLLDDISTENISKINNLRLSDKQISNISSLSNLKNLKTLYLDYNQISNISPLSNCINLEELNLDDNEISNISPLSNLENLKYLTLTNNKISDILPLSNLKNLELLYSSNNQISDISPLSKCINLEYLYLNINQISDISPLSNLKNLKHLYLEDNKISDISSLSTLINLDHLYLIGNNLNKQQINELKNKLPNTYIDF